MSYITLSCSIENKNDYVIELLTAELFNIGFESFEETEFGLKAYIPKEQFNIEVVKSLPINEENKIIYSFDDLPEKNWNEEWEKNYYQPIVIADKCLIKSSFHTNTPKTEYTILIDPKMSFGTGHHETTSLVLEYILQIDIKNKTVLDMGCGTGVLGILASMRGATEILGIDIDEWAYNNSIENITLNNITNMSVIQGDVNSIPNKKYDIIFANINLNILLNDIKFYAKHIEQGGEIYFSGFYQDAIHEITGEAEKYNFRYIGFLEKNRWVAIKMVKE